jgi:hypothetical protein
VITDRSDGRSASGGGGTALTIVMHTSEITNVHRSIA